MTEWLEQEASCSLCGRRIAPREYRISEWAELGADEPLPAEPVHTWCSMEHLEEFQKFSR